MGIENYGVLTHDDDVPGWPKPKENGEDSGQLDRCLGVKMVVTPHRRVSACIAELLG
jgi:hypothetical protein